MFCAAIKLIVVEVFCAAFNLIVVEINVLCCHQDDNGDTCLVTHTW